MSKNPQADDLPPSAAILSSRSSAAFSMGAGGKTASQATLASMASRSSGRRRVMALCSYRRTNILSLPLMNDQEPHFEVLLAWHCSAVRRMRRRLAASPDHNGYIVRTIRAVWRLSRTPKWIAARCVDQWTSSTAPASVPAAEAARPLMLRDAHARAARWSSGPDPSGIRRMTHRVERSWDLNDRPIFDVADAGSLSFTPSGYDDAGTITQIGPRTRVRTPARRRPDRSCQFIESWRAREDSNP